MNFANDANGQASMRESLFKILYINGYYGAANSENIALLSKNLADTLYCVDTQDGLCPA